MADEIPRSVRLNLTPQARENRRRYLERWGQRLEIALEVVGGTRKSYQADEIVDPEELKAEGIVIQKEDEE